MEIKHKPRVISCVTSDLVTDQRVHRAAHTLQQNGFSILLVGRQKNDSQQMPARVYPTKRFKLWFEKGPLFYACYNIKLFIYLLFSKFDILLANDLDTLSACFLIAKIRGKKLVYDSHEYFTGVPELQSRPHIQQIWKIIEQFIFPKLKQVYTVNTSIAQLYEQAYNVPVKVIRNIPELKVLAPSQNFPVPKDLPIILVQGAGINIDRGIEEAVEAMQFVHTARLLIIGGGDVIDSLKALSKQLQLEEKVFFVAKMSLEKLKSYTLHCSLGLSLDKDTNINYRFSLPNKLFDYIHAGMAVLATPLPEIKAVIDQYQIGTFINNHHPKHIAAVINDIFANPAQLQIWQRKALDASKILNWQEEQKVLLEIFSQLK